MSLEYLSPPIEQTPEGILKQFNEYMELQVPGWTPAAGNLDFRLASAASFIIAQLAEAASDGATNVYRYFGANIAKIFPHEAVGATGKVTILATDTLGHEIPAGTVVVWLDSKGNRQAFETVSEAKIEAGKNNVTNVLIKAITPGEEGNGISGAALELSAPLAFLSSMTLEAPTTEGANAEEDAAFLSRLTEGLRLLTPKPITSRDFSTWLLQKTNVGRATTIGGYNAAATLKVKYKLATSTILTVGSGTNSSKIIVGTAVSGTGIPAETFVTEIKSTTELVISKAATETKENELTFTGLVGEGGFVSSWVGKANGLALTTEERATLEKELEAELLTGVVAKVLSPVYTKIKVTCIVSAYTNQSAAIVKEAVEKAIKEYINPENWGQPPFGKNKEWINEPRVRYLNLEHIILGVGGVHFLEDVKLNAGTVDVIMTGGPVTAPELETLTVTVNLG